MSKRIVRAAAAVAGCALAGALACAPALAEEAAGRWAGRLPPPAGLHLVITVAKAADGTYSGALMSPDQGPQAIPASKVEATGDRLVFTVAPLHLVYDARWDAAKSAWVGSFSQNGRSFPLEMTRLAPGAQAARPRRPQEEVIAAAPRPYRAEDVVFADPAAAGVRLAGTLTLPEGKGPFPAVVLISGSGPNRRDEDVAGHRVFLVLADHLTRHGLAVLRYDKRGVGQSKGDYAGATTADFAADAAAAVAYLRSRPDIDARRVGLIGHSEGGEVAPMVAAKDPSLAFVVMMAGPGVPGRDLMPEQVRQLALAAGAPPAAADLASAQERKLLEVITDAKDAADAEAQARAVLGPKGGAGLGRAVQTLRSPWMRYFLAYDPAPVLRQVRVPVLALNGALDRQVPAAQNLPPIRAALAGDKDVTVIEMPGLNHLFQHAKTGALGEYGAIEETLAPELLQTVTDWIGEHVR